MIDKFILDRWGNAKTCSMGDNQVFECFCALKKYGELELCVSGARLDIAVLERVFKKYVVREDDVFTWHLKY